MTTTLKERSILLSGSDVRAIIDGRKTQLRRVVKPTLGPQAYWTPWEGRGTFKANGLIGDIPVAWRSKILYSPYGIAERLFVKETWQPFFNGGFIYLADAGTSRINAVSEEHAKAS